MAAAGCGVIVGLLVGFVVGVLVGALFVTRNMHRVLARLAPAERVAFARKVNATVRR